MRSGNSYTLFLKVYRSPNFEISISANVECHLLHNFSKFYVFSNISFRQSNVHILNTLFDIVQHLVTLDQFQSLPLLSSQTIPTYKDTRNTP